MKNIGYSWEKINIKTKLAYYKDPHDRLRGNVRLSTSGYWTADFYDLQWEADKSASFKTERQAKAWVKQQVILDTLRKL